MSESELLEESQTALNLPDRPVVTLLAAARAALSRRGLSHLVDARGAAPALLAHALALAGAPHVLYVAKDADSARRATQDLSALSRGLPLNPKLSRASSPDAAPLLLSVGENS